MKVAGDQPRSARVAECEHLGCVIKVDTSHVEFISLAASTGIMTASLTTGIPIAVGILTTYTDEQAAVRSARDTHNKRREAAAACLETAVLLRALNTKH